MCTQFKLLLIVLTLNPSRSQYHRAACENQLFTWVHSVLPPNYHSAVQTRNSNANGTQGISKTLTWQVCHSLESKRYFPDFSRSPSRLWLVYKHVKMSVGRWILGTSPHKHVPRTKFVLYFIALLHLA